MPPNYNTYTYNSPNLLLRWFHQKRFLDAIKLIGLEQDGTLLDYGCGDGHLLQLCREQFSGDRLFGFEPAESLLEQATNQLKGTGVLLSDRLEALPHAFDRIACLEVCEHLAEPELEQLISKIKERMGSESEVVFSVPVESGLPGFIKNIFRLIKNEKKDHLTVGKLFRILFEKDIEREIGVLDNGLPYYFSHVGFNHKIFERKIRPHFRIQQKTYSPFRFLFRNNVFYVCRKVAV